MNSEAVRRVLASSWPHVVFPLAFGFASVGLLALIFGEHFRVLAALAIGAAWGLAFNIHMRFRQRRELRRSRRS
jgi:hypothetical protein